MQLRTTSAESKFPNEYIGIIFIQIDQHLKKLLKKYKGSRFYGTRCIRPTKLDVNSSSRFRVPALCMHRAQCQMCCRRGSAGR